MFNEVITVQPCFSGKLIDPHAGVQAYQRSVAGAPGWSLNGGHLYEPGSRIIQADGTVWVVVKCYDAAPEVRVEAKRLS